MDDGTYADLSRLSYEKDFEVKAKEADSLGWDVDKELSTYNATVFKNKSSGKAVIAYRGTNPLNLEDLAVDLDIAFGLRKHKRFQEAEDLYKIVCQKYHNAQVTGHSLGGALALFVNDLYGVPVACNDSVFIFMSVLQSQPQPRQPLSIPQPRLTLLMLLLPWTSSASLFRRPLMDMRAMTGALVRGSAVPTSVGSPSTAWALHQILWLSPARAPPLTNSI